MFLNITRNPYQHPPSYQQGISLAFLLFTIIVVSLLAAALMRLNAQSTISIAHQVVSTRAFFAAESGANLNALSIFPISGAGACTNQNYTFNVAGLDGCSASTTCTAITINSNNYYQVISAGQCNSGQALQATRTIEVRLKGVNSP